MPSDEYVLKVRGDVDSSFDNAQQSMDDAGKKAENLKEKTEKASVSLNGMLEVLGFLGEKVMGMASSVSETAEVIEDFAGTVDSASQRMEALGNKAGSAHAKFLILLGVFSAATAGIYKFVKSAGEAEMSLEKMAKKQHKTVETTRASQTALEAMGKTLKEVKGDKELNKTYKELVKINEEMALPNMEASLANLKEMRAAFWELRSTAKYALDWIGARVLRNLEEPIKRITGKMRDVAKWLRNNLDSVTMKISSGITAFIKGIEGAVRGIENIIEMISEIDPNIRKIGAAILFVMGLIKSGPLGQILTMLTLVGSVIDDLDNYRYNKQNGFNPGDEGYVPLALPNLWETLFPDGGNQMAEGGVSKALDGIFAAINTKLEELAGTLKSLNLWDSVFGKAEDFGGVLGEIASYIQSNDGAEKIRTIAKNSINVIKEGVAAGGALVGDVAGLILTMFSGDNTDLKDQIEAGTHNNSWTSAISSGLLLKLMGVPDLGAVGGAISTLFSQARETIEDDLAKEGLKFADDNAKNEEINKRLAGQLNLDFANFINLFAVGLKEAANTAHVAADVVGDLLTGIMRSIFNPNDQGVGTIVDTVLTDVTTTTGWESFITGVSTGLVTGNGTIGLIAGLADAFEQYFGDGSGDKFKEDCQKLGHALKTIWYGTWNEEKKEWNNNGLGSVFEGLWFGEDGKSGIQGTLSKTWNKITAAVTDWWLGAPTEDPRGMGNPNNKRTGGFRTKLVELLFGKQDKEDVSFGEAFGAWFDGIKNSLSEKIGGFKEDLLKKFDEFWRGAEEKGDHHGGLRALLFGEEWGDNSEFGKDELGGVLGQFVTFFNHIVELASQAGSQVWRAFFNTLPQKIQDALSAMGVQNPNESSITTENGKTYLESSNTKKIDINPEQAEKLPPGLLKYLSVDENGKILFTGKYTGKENEKMLNGWGPSYSTALLAYLNGDVPFGYTGGGGFAGFANALFGKEGLGAVFDDDTLRGLHIIPTTGKPSNPRTKMRGQHLPGREGEKAGDSFYGEGNIDLNNRQVVYNADGSISTEKSISFEEDGKEVLIPTVVGGKIVSDDEAWDHYIKSGEFLGKFDTAEEADRYAVTLHNRQEAYYGKGQKGEGAEESVDANMENADKTIEEWNKELTEREDAYLPIDADMETAQETADDFVEDIKERDDAVMPINGNAEGAIGAAEAAVAQINGMSATISVGVNLGFNMGGTLSGITGKLSSYIASLGKKAMGGRFGTATTGIFGEDGPEYIIPITKPNRAAALIKQMFNEMGSSAVNQVIGDLGLGAGTDTIGKDYASIAEAMGGTSSVTNNNTVSAPVNIYVTASGVGAEDVGERAYDAAQRHMLRTLKGVFA